MEPRVERCYSSKESSVQGMASQPTLLCIRVTLRREIPQHSRWKSSKCTLRRISDINWIPITGKQTRYFGKLTASSQ